MKTSKEKKNTQKGNRRDYRNETAAFLSIIPGAGHIYKGHYVWGFILLIISPFFVWLALYFGETSGGFSWYIPIIYVLATAGIAYRIHNIRNPRGVHTS